VVGARTTIGKNNHIHPFASVGGHPQCYEREHSEECRLEIGDVNIIHECCTINRGTSEGEGVTRIGHRNLLMAYVHVAKDCFIGNHVVLINHATLGGHVKVYDHAVLSAFVAIRQCCEVGTHAFITRASKVAKDVLAYTIVQGNPPKSVGINKVGLQRRGFTSEALDELSEIYKIIFSSGLVVAESIEAIEKMPESSQTRVIIAQLKGSDRGIVR
jgi:UDP-N-acetylglucosamine acyltransferase